MYVFTAYSAVRGASLLRSPTMECDSQAALRAVESLRASDHTVSTYARDTNGCGGIEIRV